MSARGRKPLVSVCIPTRDGARYLGECLDSVLAQSLGDFELLVVDDASTDGTPALVESRLRGDPRLRLHRNESALGLVGNWNRCVELARGEWVKFAFQDDALAPDCLSRLLAASRPGVPLVAGRRALKFEAGVPESVRRAYRRHAAEQTLARRFPGRSFIPAREFAELMLRHPVYNCVGEPTAVMIRRSAFRRRGAFNADLINLCDWEFLARLAVHEGLCYADEALATFRVHTASASALNSRLRLYRSEVIDELIIRHDLAHAPAYAPVRRAAALSRPRVDLLGSLAAAARRSRVLAGRYRRASEHGEDPALVWEQVLARYPRLSALSVGAAGGPKRLEAARGLWKAAAARN